MLQTQQSYLKSKLDLSIYCVGTQRIGLDASLNHIKKKQRKPGLITANFGHIAGALTAAEIKDSPYQRRQSFCTYQASQMNFSVALLLKEFQTVKCVGKDLNKVVVAEKHFRHLYSVDNDAIEPWCSLDEEGVVVQ